MVFFCSSGCRYDGGCVYNCVMIIKHILPSMTFGCQTWSLSKAMGQKLRTAQRAMERNMLDLKIKDKFPYTEIKKRTRVQDIVQFVLKQKWKWAGHVARLDDNRWTQRVTEWQPREGRRSRGRQRKRWRDNLVQLKGVTWRHDAQHRQRWRSDVEGYFQQWRNQSCGNLSPFLQSPPPPKEKKKKKQTKNKVPL